MTIQKTEGIVLRTHPFRNTSLIVTFFTRDFGKLKTLAKGVREESAPRALPYELFSRLEIVFYEKTRSDLHLISQSYLTDSYHSLRSHLEGIAYASYWVELVDELSEVQDPHPAIFELLDFAFRYLSSLPGERLSRIFEIKVLREIGWLPFLNECLHCGQKAMEQGFFSPRQGALFCSRCAARYEDTQPIGPETLAAMRYYIQRPVEEAARFHLSPKTQKDLHRLLHAFLIDRLGKVLKSQRFLDKIRAPLRSLASL